MQGYNGFISRSVVSYIQGTKNIRCKEAYAASNNSITNYDIWS